MRKIKSILLDPIWQFVGVFFTIAAFGLAAYPLITNSRELQLVILANTSLVEIDKSIENEITVLYGEQEIDNLKSITLKLENSGTEDILPQDYESPITIIFPENARVLRAIITDSDPPNIKSSIGIDWNQNIVTLSKSLINSGETLILQVMVMDIPVNTGNIPFTISERIVGISSIPVISAIDDNNTLNQAWQTGLSIAVSLLGVFVSAIFTLRNKRSMKLSTKILEKTQLTTDQLGDKAQLTYQGQAVNNLWLLKVELRNTGNQPIRRKDYVEPITFIFPDNSKVAEAVLEKAHPSAIETDLKIEKQNTVLFSADLINPTESIVLRFVVGNINTRQDEQILHMTSRIIGLGSMQFQQ